ncbi:MAG: hypothetical protein C0609_00180 [Deltaproteobacteria bacterium]|nr:MAG: hypothetical protein C0609_00180 [Deltaproteobacteria bacterium]
MQRKTLTAILALSLLIFPCTGSLADLREEMAARADRVAGMLVDESPTVRRDGAKKIERDIENNLRDFSTDEESPIYLEELYKALAPLTESDKSTIRLRTARLLEGFTDSIIEMGLVENSTQLLQSIYPVAPDEEIRAKIGEALDERGAKKPDIKSMPLAAVEPPPSQDEKTEMDKPAAKGQSVPEEETAITEVTKAENPPPEPPVKVEPPKTP